MLIKVLLLMLSIMTLSFAQKKPEPFGLKLGVSKKEVVLSVIRKEGGKVVGKGHRKIKANITNPNVEWYIVAGLPVENLSGAMFLFYKSKLYNITYAFVSSSEVFQLLLESLIHQYGEPDEYKESGEGSEEETAEWDSVARWNFGDIVMTLTLSWAEDVVLTYEHLPTVKQVETSDQEILRREITKPKRGL